MKKVDLNKIFVKHAYSHSIPPCVIAYKLNDYNEFGVIVFESKSELDPMEVYQAYSKRWEIEAMFSFYKNIIDLDTVNVHSDYRVYAAEFINLLSVIVALRVKKMLASNVLVKKKKGAGTEKAKSVSEIYSFRQVFRYLSKVKKVRVGESEKWTTCETLRYIKDLTDALCL